MKKIIYCHENSVYKVVFESRFIQQILQYCQKKMPLETGGILVGKYTEDGCSAEITFITGPPSDSKHTRQSFYRGTKELNLWLTDSWSKGEYYLGEWHFHPNSSSNPSYVDKRQMKLISTDSNYNCPEPILLIIGGDPKKIWTSSCFVFPRKKSIIMLNDEVIINI
ncbi:MAG: Mov34/MPN/PAD-1 family protein [Candidatus Pristimantibacillus sp.]